MNRLAWLWLVGALLCQPLYSQAKAEKRGDAVEAHIHAVENGLERAVEIEGAPEEHLSLAERMNYYHVPGVSIAVIHNGVLEWSRGYGKAAIDGLAVTPETMFTAASISKPVSAIATLRLAQAGKLNLDTDADTYLKSWKLPASSFTAEKKITVRELLNHTSGLDRHGVGMYMSSAGQVPTLIEELNGQPPARVRPLNILSVPGTQWSYSGGGYTVLQQVLTDVTGERFDELMRKTVLEPAGMTHSTFQQNLSADQQKQIAMPYTADGKPVPGGYPIFAAVAAGGLWTTPSDLARLAIEIQRELAGKSHRILSKATAEEMLQPGLGKWGLGFQVGGSTEPYFAHEGADIGYNCYMVAYDHGDGVVIMTNGMGQLEYEILRSVSRAYGWPDFKPEIRKLVSVDTSTYDRLTGTYNFLIVTREGDKLMAEIPGGVRKTQMFPESATRFFLLDNPIEIEFHEDGQHHVVSATFATSVLKMDLKKNP